MLADGLESADDEQRTPKADLMDVDEPGSGGRYPTSKLFKRIRKIPFKRQLLGNSFSFGTDCSYRTA